MTALAKTLVMALYGKISPGEMALVRGEGLVRAAYSSARPGLALPFPCCQYLAAHDAARDAGFDAAAQSASTALPPFAVAPPPSLVHSRHPVAVASAAHLDTAAALAVAALAALALAALAALALTPFGELSSFCRFLQNFGIRLGLGLLLGFLAGTILRPLALLWRLPHPASRPNPISLFLR